MTFSQRFSAVNNQANAFDKQKRQSYIKLSKMSFQTQADDIDGFQLEKKVEKR